MASPATPQLDTIGNDSKWETKMNRAHTVKEGLLRPSNMFYSNVWSTPHGLQTCPTLPKLPLTRNTLINSLWTIPLCMHLWIVQHTVKLWTTEPGQSCAGLKVPLPVCVPKRLSCKPARAHWEIGRCLPDRHKLFKRGIHGCFSHCLATLTTVHVNVPVIHRSINPHSKGNSSKFEVFSMPIRDK